MKHFKQTQSNIHSVRGWRSWAGALLLAGATITAHGHHLGDRVWLDANRNGLQDAGEPGINGVTVELYDCPTGNLIAAQVTHNNGTVDGFYMFGENEVRDRTVYVRFLLPAGYSFTVQGSDDSLLGVDEIDSDANPATGQTVCTSIYCAPAEDYLHCQQDQWDAGLVLNQSNEFDNPGTGTPGYWKNHPEAWPVSSITIGGVTYTKAQALSWMGKPDGDKTVTLFRALVSAELNVLIGNDSSCIEDTLDRAHQWFIDFGPVGSGVKARSNAWKVGEPLYLNLDAYNNGKLCAPHRD